MILDRLSHTGQSDRYHLFDWVGQHAAYDPAIAEGLAQVTLEGGGEVNDGNWAWEALPTYLAQLNLPTDEWTANLENKQPVSLLIALAGIHGHQDVSNVQLERIIQLFDHPSRVVRVKARNEVGNRVEGRIDWLAAHLNSDSPLVLLGVLEALTFLSVNAEQVPALLSHRARLLELMDHQDIFYANNAAALFLISDPLDYQTLIYALGQLGQWSAVDEEEEREHPFVVGLA